MQKFFALYAIFNAILFLPLDSLEAQGGLEGDSSEGNVAHVTIYVSAAAAPGGDGSEARPYSTIQEGINHAGEGDHVVIGDGIYTGPGNRNLDFEGKKILVRGLNGPDKTVIDCQGVGRGFYFHSGEDRESVLQGVKIINGLLSMSDTGGGIGCESGSSPTLRNCVIEACASPKGGGLSCVGASSPLLIDCAIRKNIAETFGGGIYVEKGSNLTLVSSKITLNEAKIAGGGIFIEGWSFKEKTFGVLEVAGEEPEILENMKKFDLDSFPLKNLAASLETVETGPAILEKIKGFEGQGLSFANLAAALETVGVRPEALGYLNKWNRAQVKATLESAGVDFAGLDSQPRIERCRITRNFAWVAGGGIACHGYSTPLIESSLVTLNHANRRGGGIYSAGKARLKVWGSTVVDNEAPVGGGVYQHPLAPVEIRNSILWYNTNFAIRGSKVRDVKYSCVSSITEGEGNINKKPRFTSLGDIHEYRLTAHSPCKNAGSNEYVTVQADLRGQPRFVDGIVDIGAEELSERAKRAIDTTTDSVDTDGDGVEDGWEDYYHTDKNNPHEYAGDFNLLIKTLKAAVFSRESYLYKPPLVQEGARFYEFALQVGKARHDEEVDAARPEALALGYQIDKFIDIDPETKARSGLEFYILREIPNEFGLPSRGWGTYFINLDYKVDALVEVPHPLNDTQSPSMGAQAWRLARARYFLMSGTHRHVNERHSGDVSHLKKSIFFEVHKAWNSLTEKMVTWQIHGYSSYSGRHDYPEETIAVISNSWGKITPQIIQVDSILDAAGLTAYVYNTLPRGHFLNAMVNRNPRTGAEEQGSRFSLLGATTNVQGNHAKEVGATFTHVEVDYPIRFNPSLRMKIAALFAQAMSTEPPTMDNTVDTDQDGITNDWELAQGFDPYDDSDGVADPDGDEFVNIYEFVHGTDPHDANSVPGVTMYVAALPEDQYEEGYGQGDGSKNNPYRTLYDAFKAMNNYDIVRVDDGIYKEANLRLPGAPLVLTSSNGPNSCIIDAEGRGRILNMGGRRDSRWRVKGFTFRNGKWKNYGAGIRFGSLANIIVEDCIIENCTSLGTGGGVYFTRGASPTLVNCVIRRNYAAVRGAGFYARNLGTTPALINCRIEENEAGESGGGAYSTAESAPVLKNCIITNNKAQNFGGGTYCYGGSTMKMIDTTISSNEVIEIQALLDEKGNPVRRYESGGGIYIGGGVKQPPAGEPEPQWTAPSFENCSITDNMADNAGGGVYVTRGAKPILKNCLIARNQVTVRGAGVYVRAQASTPIFDNCRIEKNVSVRSGGGFYSTAESAPILKNCIITRNTAQDFGGGIYCYGGSRLKMTDSEVTFNKVIERIPVKGVRRYESGGGIYIGGKLETPEVREIEPDEVAPEIIEPQWTAPSFENCSITDNMADNAGGGVYVTRGAKPIFTDCLIARNQVTVRGGGTYIRALRSEPTFNNCRFEENVAVRSGGGVYSTAESAPVLKNCIITRNSAQDFGGGVYCYGGSSLKMYDSEVTFNKVIERLPLQGVIRHQNGGGVYIGREPGGVITTVLFSGCQIADNEANVGGGGVYITQGSTPLLKKNTIARNKAGVRGGGIYVKSPKTSPLIEDSRIIDNIAAQSGGGLYGTESASPTMARCSITGNKAEGEDGGGIYCRDGAKITISESKIQSNKARDQGGGIYVTGETHLELTRSLIEANEAASKGGGVACNTGSSALITSSIFASNTASRRGGAIYGAGKSSITIQNSTIVNNKAQGSGGGIFHFYNTPTEVKNSILWANSPGEIVIGGGQSPPDVKYSCVEGVLVLPGKGNTNSNPLFGSDGFRITADSPARDAGDPDTLIDSTSLDIDGEPRIIADRIDMGADEYMP